MIQYKVHFSEIPARFHDPLRLLPHLLPPLELAFLLRELDGEFDGFCEEDEENDGEAEGVGVSYTKALFEN